MAHNHSHSSESFYSGGDSVFSPDFNKNDSVYTGFNRLNASQIGFSVNPMTGNQLSEALGAIRQGGKVFEVQLLAIQGEADQNVPRQHLDEIRALTKLTGVQATVHGNAPGMDAAGFHERGWGGEESRSQNERRMFDSIKKAHLISPDKPIPVTLHTGNTSSYTTTYIPDEKNKKKAVPNAISVINLSSKQTQLLEPKIRYDLERPDELDQSNVKEKQGHILTPEKQIKSANVSEWENSLLEFANYSKHTDEIIGPVPLELRKYQNARIKDNKLVDATTGEPLPELSPEQENNLNRAIGQISQAELFVENMELSLHNLFDRVYKYGTDKQRKELKNFSQEYVDESKKIPQTALGSLTKKQLLHNSFEKLRNVTSGIKIENGKMVRDDDFSAPKVFVNASDFAMKEAAKTFGNLGYKTYTELGGKNSPFVAIENIYEGLGFWTADEQKKLVDMARENMVRELTEKKKMSKSKAMKIAEDKIGVTWDLSHINIAKKSGFTDEFIIEQTKKIAPYVKHLHIADNFGFGDTHLAPGMGNAPIKQMMEQLEKEGKLKDVLTIIEAGGFNQTFKRGAHNWSLSAFGSAGFGGGSGAPAYGPSFNDAFRGGGGAYFGGIGEINPQIHHSIYGAGFTTMPATLGGQMPGGQSRFGGTPMA